MQTTNVGFAGLAVELAVEAAVSEVESPDCDEPVVSVAASAVCGESTASAAVSIRASVAATVVRSAKTGSSEHLPAMRDWALR